MTSRKRPRKKQSTPGNRDRRADVRVPLRAAVYLSGGDELVRGWVRNLSQGGVFVECKARFPEETEVCLEFMVWEGETPMGVTIAGWVARTDDEGMGIQFAPATPEMVAQIGRLLTQFLAPA